MMDIMTVNIIYEALWKLLHFLASLYDICLWVRFRIFAFALWSYDQCHTQAKRQQNDYDFLRQCKQQLNKIPKHLNIIIGPEAHQNVNDELLARIFSYALYMDIDCVSFYDTRCDASKRTKCIKLDKVKCPAGWTCKNLEENRAVWYGSRNNELSNGTTTKSLNGCVADNCSKSSCNGFSKTNIDSKSLEIYQIQPKDNRPLIALACRNLFRQRHTTEVQQILKDRNQLTSRIDDELAKQLQHLSEPELSIVFSESLCTFGMLPWHSRCTEFQRHATGKRFDVESFAKILYIYSRCEQRWGK